MRMRRLREGERAGRVGRGVGLGEKRVEDSRGRGRRGEPERGVPTSPYANMQTA